MNYDLTEEQKSVGEQMRSFCLKEIAPNVPAVDRSSNDKASSIVKDNIRKLARVGYLGCGHEKVYGGAEGNFLQWVVAGEEVAKVCPSTFLAAEVSSRLFGMILTRYGTKEQKENHLPALIDGEFVGSFGLAGLTSARLNTGWQNGQNGWCLNGRMKLVGNAPFAHMHMIVAGTEEQNEPGHDVKTFIVKKNAPGLTVGRPLDKIGFKGFPVADVFFDKCEVSEADVIGMAGRGNEVIECTLNLRSLVTAVSALGTARASMEEAVGYLKNRKGGGLSQAASFKCADMMIMTDVSRLLIYQAAWAMDTHNPEAPVLATSAKIFAADAANQISHMVVELQGEDGYTAGSVSEKLSRDARFYAICGGPSEVQRDFVGTSVLNGFRKRGE